ncbi:MAG: ATP-binding protein [Bdellovibrio sp.]|nr:ATP-binding protein [Bdellovibrio sp.]
MKLKSLIENGRQLEIADVEIEFIPGIPQIHFLGLPDRIIKESFYRIKSALKSSGYKFPLTQQMIVNIKPSHLRKSSRGVELAVALGILLKTKQIAPDKINLNWVLYGELGLDGSVYEPTDLSTQFLRPPGVDVLTGWSKEIKNNYFRLHELKTFEVYQNLSPQKDFFKRPELGLKKLYSKQEAEFLFLVATTGLHGLLAGDSGAGKSTLAKSAISFLSEPQSEQIGRWKHNWRPVIMPHPSITAAAFLGGGGNLYQGEIERVENGLLILDELLEFDTQIVETLRGPMTGETLRLVRGSEEREIQCNFQVIATSNLCQCGKWTPLKDDVSCRYSRTKCTRYLERLSGPFVDRFGLMMFTHQKVQRTIAGDQILKRVEKVRQRRSIQQGDVLPSAASQKVIPEFYGDFSTRRLNFLTQVASVFALERAAESSSAPQIEIKDYNRAEEWVITPFRQLEKGMS